MTQRESNPVSLLIRHNLNNQSARVPYTIHGSAESSLANAGSVNEFDERPPATKKS
jgi:hypothetical protein